MVMEVPPSINGRVVKSIILRKIALFMPLQAISGGVEDNIANYISLIIFYIHYFIEYSIFPSMPPRQRIKGSIYSNT